MQLRYFYLENQEGTAYKFYLAAAAENGDVCLKWGKIGTKGQEQVYPTSFSESLKEVRAKVTSKVAKGYKLLVDDKALAVLPGMEWADAFFDQHSGTSPAQAPTPMVSCCDCGTGGWDLAGWKRKGEGVQCFDCQVKAASA